MTDCIYLSGIRAFGHTGYLPEEQTLGQWFEVDLTLWVDLAPAGASDRLEHTYDYSTAVKAIQHLIRTERFKLIETLVEAIAAIPLQSPLVDRVKVRLTKVTPPIPDFDGRVAVEITRPLPIAPTA